MEKTVENRWKKISVSPAGMEESLKKGVSEMLVLFLLAQGEKYVGEMTELLYRRSGGRLDISFPYAIIYRLLDARYIQLADKRPAPDGRRRQYYRISPEGRTYLNELLATFRRFMGGVEQIFMAEEEEEHG